MTFFGDNTDFFGGNTFSKSPIYAVQGHAIYTFRSGIWMALDGLYFAGGSTALNGIKSDNEQANTRAGFTVALPIDRQNSLKLSASPALRPVREASSTLSVSGGSIVGAMDIDDAGRMSILDLGSRKRFCSVGCHDRLGSNSVLGPQQS